MLRSRRKPLPPAPTGKAENSQEAAGEHQGYRPQQAWCRGEKPHPGPLARVELEPLEAFGGLHDAGTTLHPGVGTEQVFSGRDGQ